VPEYRCLTYCSIPYNGHGWPETCASMLRNFRSAGLTPILVVPRVTKPLPAGVRVLQSLPFPLSKLPWQFAGAQAVKRLDCLFEQQIALADPATTAAYFWPGSPPALIQRAKDAGILTIGQMINTFQGTAKKILDRAYARWALPSGCSISQQDIDFEISELNLYDFVFAPNPEVERSLQEAGVETQRIISTSFGWLSSRYAKSTGFRDAQRPLRFLFVGTAGVRKGVPTLLQAWKNARIAGELVIVGHVEAAIQDRVSAAIQDGSVRHVAFTEDIDGFYRNADIFVFPTIEEGGPQVTLEAGGCGLPVITTPMGAARLVEHDVNGLIVEAENVDDLTEAMLRMARNAHLRAKFSRRIERDAERFTYDNVSASHARTIVGLLQTGMRCGPGRVLDSGPMSQASPSEVTRPRESQ
jgi:glycosyltransferase involved in cell wall biosynthesis